MSQIVESLLSKYEVLNLNPSIIKNIQMEREEERGGGM
jgi:hypothetical protein